MSLRACPLGGLQCPGNGGSLRDLTLKLRYWLLPPLLLFIYLFISRFVDVCVCVRALCVCALVCSWLWVVVVVVESGGGGWGVFADIRMGQIQVAVAVTGSVVWAVLTRSSLDALEELVDSWELLAVSRALVFSAAGSTWDLICWHLEHFWMEQPWSY